MDRLKDVATLDAWLLIEDTRKLRELARAERERSVKLRSDLRTQVAISHARRTPKPDEVPAEVTRRCSQRQQPDHPDDRSPSDTCLHGTDTA